MSNTDTNISNNNTIETYNSDIESNIRNTIHVSHNRTDICDIFSTKLLISITIFYMSIVIFDIYYALYDDTCVNQRINSSITLYIYLLIDAIYGISLAMFLPVILFIFDLDNEGEKQIFNLITLFRTLIILVWTTMGTYIFWGLMDNNKCEKTIYYYMLVSIIIRYIFGILFLGITINI